MDAESWVGRTLDERYRVEDVLGEGGMGVVLAARHVVLGHGVAIKLMRPDAGPVWRRRFEQEARACSQIDNEHVAKVYDFGELDDGTPFLAMELLEGRDLADKIYSDGPLSAAEAIDYGLQVCEALGAAHALGIVHRDVKPANLFLTQRPDGSACIKLLDFGISKHPPEGNVPGSLTGTHALLGSPQFMSPEQLASSRSVDARTDIWSLGVTLFELMTLDYPFAGESLAEICTAIMRDEPRRLRGDRPELPQALEDVIDACLEKDKRDRVQSAHELALRLRALSRIDLGASEPVPSSRPPSLPTTLVMGAADHAAADLASVTPTPPLPRIASLMSADTVEAARVARADEPCDDHVLDDLLDSLDVTPAPTVRPVTLATTAANETRPRWRRAALLGFVALLFTGATTTAPAQLAVLSPLPALATPAPVTANAVADDTETAEPIAAPSDDPAPVVSAFSDSMQLSPAHKRAIERHLSAGQTAIDEGRLDAARREAQAALKLLKDVGVLPFEGVSALGAQVALFAGRIEAAALRASLTAVEDRADGERRRPALRRQVAVARAAYGRVHSWGVRSFHRCALAESAALDAELGRAFADAATRADNEDDRRWLIKAAVASLRDARTGFATALRVPAETTLCFDEARDGGAAVRRDLGRLGGS